MAVTEDKVLLPTEIGGSVKLSIGIMNPFRTHTVNQTDPAIQKITVWSNLETEPGHSDWEYFPLESLESGTDVPRSGRNIDNRTGMNSQVPIVTTILESNITSNCNIFNSFRRDLDIVYRGLLWQCAEKIESENLWGNKIFEIAEHKNNFLMS